MDAEPLTQRAVDVPDQPPPAAWRSSALAAAVGHARAVVLVEGGSDQQALQALAARRGMDLSRDGIAVVAMGGASNVGQVLEILLSSRPDITVGGLFDAAEIGDFRRALGRVGLSPGTSPADLESLGFYMCVEDLEDELIRHLGVERVEEILAAHGELRSFRTFQRQPAQRERSDERRLRRFLGAGSGRKIRYGRLLVEALDPQRVPRPLDAVLDHISSSP